MQDYISDKSENKKKSKFRLFIKVLLVSLGTFIVLLAALVFGFSGLFGEGSIPVAIAHAIDSNLKGNSITDIFDKIPERTNFVILGLDEGKTRTDIIMVGSYSATDDKVDLISVPRDTYVAIPKDRRDILAENNRFCPSGGKMKINAVYHYAGEELGTEFIVKQLEDIFKIEINYYVKVELEAFRYIVDEIGGVEFDVPQRMYYNDPEQNLYIDLQPGLQVLNGEQAEGLVRYRKSDINNPISKGYAEGDIKRVQVQQDFLKAMIKQVINRDDFLKSANVLFGTATKYIKTNFDAADVAKYAGGLLELEGGNIRTHTIPNAMGSVDGTSYVIIDEQKTIELIDEITIDSSSKSSEEPISDSKELEIAILNGGYVSGLASKTKEMLVEKGYNVETIGDFSGDKVSNTRIFVRKKGLAADLMKLFNGSEIVVDINITKDSDIVIVLGTDEE